MPKVKKTKDASGIPRYTDSKRILRRHVRRNNRKNKSQLCKYITKGLECWKINRCPYAHREANIKLINFYSKNKFYKEKPCNQGKECHRKNCVFFHDISERRFNKTIENLAY